jgi:antitoxin component YwqK of YwqJK toxin-antitoxin module
MTNSFKSKLKYHRIFMIAIVLSYIIYMYLQRGDSNTYENGQIKSTGENVGGFNEGEWIWFHDNGKMQMQGYFTRGKRKGTWKMYNRKGIIQNERTYKEDKLDGVFVDYDQKGDKYIEGEYSNDKITSRDIISKKP